MLHEHHLHHAEPYVKTDLGQVFQHIALSLLFCMETANRPDALGMTDPLAITANSRSACLSDSGPCVCSQSRNKETGKVRLQTPMIVQLKRSGFVKEKTKLNRINIAHLHNVCDYFIDKE